MNKRYCWSPGLVALILLASLLTFRSIHTLERPAANTFYTDDTDETKKAEAGPDNGEAIIEPDTSPLVAISSPADGAIIIRGALVNISAAAGDDRNVESMELYINDAVRAGTSGAILNYTWDTGQAEPGKYIIKATARDRAQIGEKRVSLFIKANEPASHPNNTRAAASNANNSTVSGSTGSISQYSRLSKNLGSFGQFRYREASGGTIQIDPQWIAENIVTITLPGLNMQVQVNKAAQDNFIHAFNLIKNGTAAINGEKVPLLSLVKTMDGTFVSRHVNWNPDKGLSNHSWGIAIDINADSHFRYVDPSTEASDPNLILWEKAFQPAGFSWGNSYGDSMHFELIP